MAEITLNKTRTAILEKCASHHGTLERSLTDSNDPIVVKAIEFLVAQKLLQREVGDAAKGFAYRLRTTERGAAALRGDIVKKL